MTSLPKLLVIGGSAGGLDVLLKILPELDNSWPLSMIIVLHRKNDNDSLLTELLAAKTTLQVKEAEEKDQLTPGVIYVTPSDYHLLIEPDGSLTLDDSEKVHYSRPSIDVTFTSAAEVFKNKLYCLLLSGANMDGAAGLSTARALGGYTVVQNPTEAGVSFMPQHAINSTTVDSVLSVAEIVEFVKSLY
jgi:two-component system, chemotaxis family, protein-glutamate methylesterase/glutaminase